MNYTKLDSLLGGENILGKKLSCKFDMMELADIGLNKKSISKIAKHFSLSLTQMASLLPILEGTLQKCTSDQPLNKYVSEQVIYITDVLIAGTEVFEDNEKLLLWLNTPHTVLNGNTPFSILSSRFGIQLVLEELGRIEHGVFS